MNSSAAGGTSSSPPALRWQIIVVLLVVSLLPLCLTAVGSWFVFGRLLEEKAIELQRAVVENHARSIAAYLAERRQLLQLLTTTRSAEEMAESSSLQALFDGLNRTSDGGFVDLGVIGPDGRHLAYVGPYDLKERNYRDADWFREVMGEGVYISDVFLGYRQVPHCIIAVKVQDGAEPWILRATINSEQFDALVRTGILGEGGDAYIVNRDGLFQTKPRVGAILDKAELPALTDHRGLRAVRVSRGGDTKILVTTRINGDRWLLVVEQDAAEIRAPVTRALTMGALVVLVSVIILVITTVLATRHLTNRIDRANRQREEMFQAFLRSAKLASVGELATGLAHEINNPLAIISSQLTNISDIAGEMDPDCTGRGDILETAERTKHQVLRCGGITAKLLQFGRQQERKPEPTDIRPRLREIVTLLRTQAVNGNVELVLDADEELPPVLLDPLELEQVLVNLIKNSLDALPHGGTVNVLATRRGDEVQIVVRDDGAGVPPEQIKRIFEPFYTTKPVGKGTGLGLSVCYGLVQSWGGRIEAESETGQGMIVRIRLPLKGTVQVGVREPGSKP